MTHILLIDDEPDILRVLSRSLQADGNDVSTALNGAEGLKVFERLPADIVITDIKMPGMDGLEVLKIVKARAPDSEVIIITGHGDIQNAIEALHFGASDFINKPVRDDALAIAIRRAAEKIDIRRRLKEYTHDLEAKIQEATRELRRRSNFLSKLIRSSNDGIIATDEAFQIVVFNPGAERILGYAQEEVVHLRRLSDLFPVELTGFFQQTMQAKRGFTEMPGRETAVVAKGGDLIPVMWSGSILSEGAKKLGTVSFLRDLREIKRLQSELVHSERLAAIGQTVAGLAHGIKNILHGLKGGSYLVDVGIAKKNDEKLRKGWDMIKRGIQRTSDLVMDLLSYSKERRPQYETCTPNAIHSRCVCDFAHGGIVEALLGEHLDRPIDNLHPAQTDAVGIFDFDLDFLFRQFFFFQRPHHRTLLNSHAHQNPSGWLSGGHAMHLV